MLSKHLLFPVSRNLEISPDDFYTHAGSDTDVKYSGYLSYYHLPVTVLTEQAAIGLYFRACFHVTPALSDPPQLCDNPRLLNKGVA